MDTRYWGREPRYVCVVCDAKVSRFDTPYETLNWDGTQFRARRIFCSEECAAFFEIYGTRFDDTPIAQLPIDFACRRRERACGGGDEALAGSAQGEAETYKGA